MTLGAFGLVGLGGALGAMARYGVSLAIPTPEGGFPWGTLAVNLIGSFLIGLLASKLSGSPDAWRLLLVTGVLGGFTTFSAFSLETLKMVQGGQFAVAGAYAVSSCLLGLGLAAIGWAAGSGQ